MRKALLLFAMLSGIAFAQPSPQYSIPTSTASGTITASAASCTAPSCVWIALPANTASVTLQLSGTFTGTVQFEASVDAVNWSAAPDLLAGATSATTTGSWSFAVNANRYFAVYASALSAGTVSVSLAASNAGGSGSVTSVGLALPNIFTVSGSPVRSTGTLTGAFASVSAHTYLGNNTGGSATAAMVQPVCGDLSNAAPSCSTDATNASNISTGTLAAAQGGTGRVSTFAPLGIAASITQPTDATQDTLTTLTIPANTLGVGSRFTISFFGNVAINGVGWTPTLTVAGTSINGLTAPAANRQELFDVRCVVYSTTSMECMALTSASGGNPYYGPSGLQSVTINTASTTAIVLKGQNSSSSASNAIVYDFSVAPVM